MEVFDRLAEGLREADCSCDGESEEDEVTLVVRATVGDTDCDALGDVVLDRGRVTVFGAERVPASVHVTLNDIVTSMEGVREDDRWWLKLRDGVKEPDRS